MGAPRFISAQLDRSGWPRRRGSASTARLRAAPWYRYITSCYLFSPWLIWLAAGAAVAIHSTTRESRLVWPMRLSLLLLAMPLFLMSFSRDRYERYMTPMIPAAAVLAGGVLSVYVGGAARLANPTTAVRSSPLPRSHHERWAHPRSMKGTDHKHVSACHPERSEGSLGVAAGRDPSQAQDDGLRLSAPFQSSSTRGGGQAEQPVLRHCLVAHLLLTGAGIIGFVIAAASGLIPSLRKVSGGAWFSPATAVFLCVGSAFLLCIGAVANRRWRGWPILATVAVALAGQAVYFNRLRDSASSRSTLRPVADLVLEQYPDAELYAYRPGGQNVISVPANDLSIHLNRTVRLVADPSRIAASPTPQVFAIYRSTRPKYVEMKPPGGWELLAKPAAGGKEDRYVFVRKVGR